MRGISPCAPSALIFSIPQAIGAEEQKHSNAADKAAFSVLIIPNSKIDLSPKKKGKHKGIDQQQHSLKSYVVVDLSYSIACKNPLNFNGFKLK